MRNLAVILAGLTLLPFVETNSAIARADYGLRAPGVMPTMPVLHLPAMHAVEYLGHPLRF